MNTQKSGSKGDSQSGPRSVSSSPAGAAKVKPQMPKGACGSKSAVPNKSGSKGTGC